MTTSKLYEFRAELECVLGLLEKNADNYYSALSLSRLIEKVNAEITAADAKSTGRTSTLAAVKRILKNSASSSVEGLKYAQTHAGFQYFCDGYRLIALSDPLPGFPEHPESVNPVNYDQLDRGEPENPVMLTLPALDSLKNWIKRKTADHKSSGRRDKPKLEYHFGAGLPTVNAVYLADMLEALRDASAVFEDGRPLNGIYFTADNGHGVLMPIHSTNTDTGRTNLAT